MSFRNHNTILFSTRSPVWTALSDWDYSWKKSLSSSGSLPLRCIPTLSFLIFKETFFSVLNYLHLLPLLTLMTVRRLLVQSSFLNGFLKIMKQLIETPRLLWFIVFSARFVRPIGTARQEFPKLNFKGFRMFVRSSHRNTSLSHW